MNVGVDAAGENVQARCIDLVCPLQTKVRLNGCDPAPDHGYVRDCHT
jgi:hypothetical protein